MSRSCFNCNYKNFPQDAVPCVYCVDYDEFEPIDEPIDEPIEENENHD